MRQSQPFLFSQIMIKSSASQRASHFYYYVKDVITYCINCVEWSIMHANKLHITIIVMNVFAYYANYFEWNVNILTERPFSEAAGNIEFEC